MRLVDTRCMHGWPWRSHTIKHAGRATVAWAQTAGKDVHPPAPAQLAVCIRSALEVTHRQARGTSHCRMGANGRQRWQPPCARPSHAVHAQCPRGHTPCAQSARRLGFNGIHPSPSPPPLRTPPPHTSPTVRLAAATASIQPGTAPAQRRQTAMSRHHPTGVCSCATATAPRGRRERRCGAAGVGDGARSGTQ
jgi:hypothetical protein